MSLNAPLRRIGEALDYLIAVVRADQDSAEPDFERLIETYLQTRRAIAREYKVMADAHLLRGEPLLQRTRLQIETRMRRRYDERLPAKYLEVSGYGGVHPALLEYLARHVGESVPSSTLRVLTGDQVHTERRVRELRDLGFPVSWKKSAGEDQYVLSSTEPDFDAAARLQALKNVRSDKSLAAEARAKLIAALD